jgi:hypothetical protein
VPNFVPNAGIRGSAGHANYLIRGKLLISISSSVGSNPTLSEATDPFLPSPLVLQLVPLHSDSDRFRPPKAQ